MTTIPLSPESSVFFSICIPVYNVELYLEECIQSVLNQSEKDFEIILVDDGSKDRSGEICDLFAQKYPHIITAIHKTNEGLLLARYDAVLVARGKYLLFLDSDDYYYHADVLKQIKNTILTHSADMLLFDWIRVFPTGEKIHETCQYANEQLFTDESKKQIYTDIVSGDLINSIAKKCIKKECFIFESNYRDHIGLNQAEDKFLSLPCIDAAKRIVYLKEPLYAYRCNPTSISRSLSLKNFVDIQKVHIRVLQYANKWNVEKDAILSLHATKWQFIVQCVLSVCKKKTRREKINAAQELADCILSDTELLESTPKCFSKLSFKYRLSAKLLYKKRIRLFFFWSNIITALQKIKQTLLP